MDDDDRRARLEKLNDRLSAARGTPVSRPHQQEHYSQANLAWRMVIELVAGLLIGFGIGYGLDSLFGTMPFFLVLFIVLGFIAGVKTIMGSAREIQETQTAEGDGPGREEEGETGGN